MWFNCFIYVELTDQAKLHIKHLFSFKEQHTIRYYAYGLWEGSIEKVNKRKKLTQISKLGKCFAVYFFNIPDMYFFMMKTKVIFVICHQLHKRPKNLLSDSLYN